MDRNTTALTQHNYYKMDFTRAELDTIYTALRTFAGLARLHSDSIDTLSHRIQETINQ